MSPLRPDGQAYRPFETSAGSVDVAEWPPIGEQHGIAVLVHGGGVRPDGWVQTIDGRAGWAPALADVGYRTYVVTWPRLRAGGTWDADTELTGDDVALGLAEFIGALGEPVCLIVHSMAAAFGYRLAFRHRHLLRALVALAPAPPGDLQPEPTILEETNEHIVVQGEALQWVLPLRGLWEPGPDFVTTKLVGASERFPRKYLSALRDQTVPIPARLLFERQNVRGAQARFDHEKLESLPVMVVVGTRDTDHPVQVDRITAAWLEECGAEVEFLPLVGDGLSGNGHMLMQETNSDEILAQIVSWLFRRVL